MYILFVRSTAYFAWPLTLPSGKSLSLAQLCRMQERCRAMILRCGDGASAHFEISLFSMTNLTFDSVSALSSMA